jgi:hypothetical protein
MIKFVPLTDNANNKIWVNPEKIVRMTHTQLDDSAMTYLTLVGDERALGVKESPEEIQRQIRLNT